MTPDMPDAGGAAHVAPLNEVLAARQTTWGRALGRFDPSDGGVDADILLLRRDPRCRVVDHPVASLDDDHPASKNLRTAVEQAGVDRGRVAVWHLVPWYLEDPDGPPRSTVWAEAVALADELWPRLTRVRSVVLLGGDAQRAWPRYAHLLPEAEVIDAPHPSPLAWHRRGTGGVRNSELVARAIRRAAGSDLA